MAYYFTDQLESVSNKYDRSNPKWVQFITDHLSRILSVSTLYELTPDELNKYRYRPKQLFSKFNVNINDAWIILLINNIPANGGIPIYVTEVYVPNNTYLSNLKENYASFENNLK